MRVDIAVGNFQELMPKATHLGHISHVTLLPRSGECHVSFVTGKADVPQSKLYYSQQGIRIIYRGPRARLL